MELRTSPENLSINERLNAVAQAADTFAADLLAAGVDSPFLEEGASLRGLVLPDTGDWTKSLSIEHIPGDDAAPTSFKFNLTRSMFYPDPGGPGYTADTSKEITINSDNGDLSINTLTEKYSVSESGSLFVEQTTNATNAEEDIADLERFLVTDKEEVIEGLLDRQSKLKSAEENTRLNDHKSGKLHLSIGKKIMNTFRNS